ncbi:MAG: prephenate dehydrogenase/arogenate dehydrogenase family protein [Planctomycetota bacterium]
MTSGESDTSTNPVDHPFPASVSILGVGLLGASVARSIRRYHPDTRLAGWARSETTAQRLGEIGDLPLDHISTDLNEICRDAEFIVVASPVNHIATLVQKAADASPPDASITDVGSTKSNIISGVRNHEKSLAKLIAAHPIAGSEKSGAQFGTADLFDNKVTIITPHHEHDPARLNAVHAFWQALGSQTIEMSPQEHDRVLANVSHVPHLISAAVAKRTTPASLPLTGSGWRDITRVAAGDVPMWMAIIEANRTSITQELLGMREELDHVIRYLENNDTVRLTEWLTKAKETKQASDL